MAQLVGESLEVVWFESRGVRNDVVVGGSDSALTDSLAHNKEVVPSIREQKERVTGEQTTITYPWMEHQQNPCITVLVHPDRFHIGNGEDCHMGFTRCSNVGLSMRQL